MYIYRKRGCSLNVGDIVYSVVVRFFFAVDFGKLVGFQILFRFLRILMYQRLQTKTMFFSDQQQPVQYNLFIFFTFLLNIE